VGIHDHRYMLALSLICGEVYNTNYKLDEEGEELNEFKFSSALNGGSAELVGKAKIGLDVEMGLEHSRWLVLPPEQLHNISCSGMAAWAVFEGKTEREETRLFSKSEAIETCGFYKSFESADEVRDHVNFFFKTFEGRA